MFQEPASSLLMRFSLGEGRRWRDDRAVNGRSKIETAAKRQKKESLGRVRALPEALLCKLSPSSVSVPVRSGSRLRHTNERGRKLARLRRATHYLELVTAHCLLRPVSRRLVRDDAATRPDASQSFNSASAAVVVSFSVQRPSRGQA